MNEKNDNFLILRETIDKIRKEKYSHISQEVLFELLYIEKQSNQSNINDDDKTANNVAKLFKEYFKNINLE